MKLIVGIAVVLLVIVELVIPGTILEGVLYIGAIFLIFFLPIILILLSIRFLGRCVITLIKTLNMFWNVAIVRNESWPTYGLSYEIKEFWNEEWYE